MCLMLTERDVERPCRPLKIILSGYISLLTTFREAPIQPADPVKIVN